MHNEIVYYFMRKFNSGHGVGATKCVLYVLYTAYDLHGVWSASQMPVHFLNILANEIVVYYLLQNEHSLVLVNMQYLSYVLFMA